MEFVSSGGSLLLGTVLGSGKLTVASGGTLGEGLTISGGTAALSGAVASGQSVVFAGSGGDLALYDASAFSASISGFAPHDKIDLAALAFVSGASATFAAGPFGGGTLTMHDGGAQVELTLIGGGYATSGFHVTSDGTHGTLVLLSSA
jgi:hypothetical protein